MRLAIFGATGQTGQQLVRQALDAGHEVVVLARTPSRLELQHERLRVVPGSLLDADRVDEVIRGADAVLSVLGPTSNKPEFVVSQGIEHILAAMQRHGVRRTILTAGAGVRDPRDRPKPVDRIAGFLLNRLSKNVAEDMRRTVARVRASDRDWTVVRVPMLTNQPARGQLKVGYVGDISPRLSRADLAAFMLAQVDDRSYIGKAPAISN